MSIYKCNNYGLGITEPKPQQGIDPGDFKKYVKSEALFKHVAGEYMSMLNELLLPTKPRMLDIGVGPGFSC